MSDGLKKGDLIRCSRCREVMFIAGFDIAPKSPMLSVLMRMPDGSPVPMGAKFQCPKCKAVWSSFSTATGNTLGPLALPPWTLPPPEPML